MPTKVTPSWPHPQMPRPIETPPQGRFLIDRWMRIAYAKSTEIMLELHKRIQRMLSINGLTINAKLRDAWGGIAFFRAVFYCIFMRQSMVKNSAGKIRSAKLTFPNIEASLAQLIEC